ncbi:hypothetical protein GCM10025873_14450 [Demequina sediminis]|nr:hypothetical protein GCM10025873_14450 [Demequina sediminis]
MLLERRAAVDARGDVARGAVQDALVERVRARDHGGAVAGDRHGRGEGPARAPAPRARDVDGAVERRGGRGGEFETTTQWSGTVTSKLKDPLMSGWSKHANAPLASLAANWL